MSLEIFQLSTLHDFDTSDRCLTKLLEIPSWLQLDLCFRLNISVNTVFSRIQWKIRLDLLSFAKKTFVTHICNMHITSHLVTYFYKIFIKPILNILSIWVLTSINVVATIISSDLIVLIDHLSSLNEWITVYPY